MMGSDLLFRQIDDLAPPAEDFHVGACERPFGQFRLRRHQALHRRDIDINKAVFLTIRWCRRQTSDKNEFYHATDTPGLLRYVLRRGHILKLVTATLRDRFGPKRRGSPPSCLAAGQRLVIQ